MPHEKFDIAKLERLNDTARFEFLIPEVLWAASDTPDPAVIVEIGAGTGLFACQFAELAPNATVFAVDAEPTMVRWMLENRSLAECGRLRPTLSTETKIPLPTGQADLVVMINVHHELADPVSSYREAHRIMAVGATILIADWSPGDTGGGPRQDVRVSAGQIGELLGEVGFEDVAQHDGLPKHSLVTARKPAV